jgi:hypothetical protein
MAVGALTRGSRLMAWLVGAVGAGVVWYAVSVYVLGKYDHAYGRLAIFQIGSALALLFAISGSIGYSLAVAARGPSPSALVATSAKAEHCIATPKARPALVATNADGLGPRAATASE